VANDNGGGSLTIEAEVVSSHGAITGGTGTVVWQNVVNGSSKGSRSFSLSASDGNWLSGQFNISAKAGEKISIQFIGQYSFKGGSCTLGNPTLTFTV
jgi:hypothetical protein